MRLKWPAIVVALIFGVISLVAVRAGFIIEFSKDVFTDPRGLFSVIGGALTGPVGAIIIGILAGGFEPSDVPLSSVLCYSAAGIWSAFAYKFLHTRAKSFGQFVLGWIGIVLVYYLVFLVPFFYLGVFIFYPGSGVLKGVGYFETISAISVEIILTVIITTLVVCFALPKHYRKPLWIP